MRKLKKQLLRTIIACGLVVSVAVGNTVAYLTDAETSTNAFTVGNVQIDLEEPDQLLYLLLTYRLLEMNEQDK